MDKPDVDFIEGLSPAVSIDQKSTSKNPRSTVGTITEVYDYLRLLYARAGRPHCPICGAPIERQTPQQIVDRVLDARGGHPVPGAGAGDPRPQGRVRRPVPPAADPGLLPGPGQRRDPPARPTRPSSTSRRSTPSRWSSTGWRSRRRPSAGSPTRSRPRSGWPAGWWSSTSSTCRPRTRAASCSSPRRWPAPTTTPSTPTTSSRGRSRSTRRSAPAPSATASAPGWRSTPSWSSPTRRRPSARAPSSPWSGAHVADYFLRLLGALGDELGFDLNTPVGGAAGQGAASRSSTATRPRCTSGTPTATAASAPTTPSSRASAPTSSAGTARPSPTPAASGSRASCARCRARPARAAGSSRSSMAVTLGGKNIAEVCALPINETADFLRDARAVRRASGRSPSGCSRRSRSGSTSCSTSASTTSPSTGRRGSLSGGEAQRIRLATQIGAGLVGVLYVLDEPSHRPAPARQPAADRDPGPAQGPRQHADRRRARRGHHPDRRLGGRHRPGRRRARRPGRRTPAPSQELLEHRDSLTGHVPLRPPADPGARGTPPAHARAAS